MEKQTKVLVPLTVNVWKMSLLQEVALADGRAVFKEQNGVISLPSKPQPVDRRQAKLRKTFAKNAKKAVQSRNHLTIAKAANSQEDYVRHLFERLFTMYRPDSCQHCCFAHCHPGAAWPFKFGIL